MAIETYFFRPDEPATYDSKELADPKFFDMKMTGRDFNRDDWRYWVPTELREQWFLLSEQAKQVAHYFASRQAEDYENYRLF